MTNKLLLYATDRSSLPRLGLCYLAAYVRQETNLKNICILESKLGTTPDVLEEQFKEIAELNPQLVGFTCITTDYEHVKKLACMVNERLKVGCFLGGPHISCLPQSLHLVFRFAVIGEGEITLAEVIKTYLQKGSFHSGDLRTIKGLAFHNENGVIELTPPRPQISDIDTLHFPARDLIDMEAYLHSTRVLYSLRHPIKRMITMVTSRGCPYKCVYCSGAAFWKKVRYRSAKAVLDELEWLFDHYTFDAVHFVDDLFIGNKKRLRILADEFVARGYNKKIKLWVSARANLFDRETAELLRKMNTVHLAFGFESGSDRVLKWLKKGSVTVEQNRNAARIAHEFGFRVEAGIILGSPGEEKADIEATYQFLIENPIDFFGVQILSPLPGSEIWELAKENGLVSDQMNFDLCWKWSGKSALNDPSSFILLNHSITKEEFLTHYKRFLKLMNTKGTYAAMIEDLATFNIKVWYNLFKNPFLLKSIFKHAIKSKISSCYRIFKRYDRSEKRHATNSQVSSTILK